MRAIGMCARATFCVSHLLLLLLLSRMAPESTDGAHATFANTFTGIGARSRRRTRHALRRVLPSEAALAP